MSNIYVASSWHNDYQPGLVSILCGLGHAVYDFRNPPNGSGFHWSEVAGEGWLESGPGDYLDYINHPRCDEGFASDFDALQWADTCILVLPCGRSAHLELGWAVGAGKRTAIVLNDKGFEPELMYKMVDAMFYNDVAGYDSLVRWLDE